jgi:hypothetical protein
MAQLRWWSVPTCTYECREIAVLYHSRPPSSSASLPSAQSSTMTVRACLLLVLVLAPFVAAIDPAFARNITVYHVNPVSFGPYPINMNTADAVGDLYFDMNQVGCCTCTRTYTSAWFFKSEMQSACLLLFFSSLVDGTCGPFTSRRADTGDVAWRVLLVFTLAGHCLSARVPQRHGDEGRHRLP